MLMKRLTAPQDVEKGVVLRFPPLRPTWKGVLCELGSSSLELIASIDAAVETVGDEVAEDDAWSVASKGTEVVGWE